jgi:hypothetical protein
MCFGTATPSSGVCVALLLATHTQQNVLNETKYIKILLTSTKTIFVGVVLNAESTCIY